jgi:hypothetical protein
VALARWSAWAPGIESERDWRRWSREPEAVDGPGAPAVRFLPAMTRRRCDALSRAMLEVAHACCDEELRGEVACVFASRHGAFATTVALLEDLAADAPLSPTRFSHSVHNTQAGLFSIWAGNVRPSSALSARAETFPHGLLEAICLLHREGGRPVLLVMGDEPVPEPLESLADEAYGAYALALLLGPAGSGAPLGLRLEANTGPPRTDPWPPALEFLRWWLSDEASLRLPSPLRTWVFDRG